MHIYHFDVNSIDSQETDINFDFYLCHHELFTEQEFIAHAKSACDRLLYTHPDRLKYITESLPLPFSAEDIMVEMKNLFEYKSLEPVQSMSLEEEYNYDEGGWQINSKPF